VAITAIPAFVLCAVLAAWAVREGRDHSRISAVSTVGSMFEFGGTSRLDSKGRMNLKSHLIGKQAYINV
jgi:hypothetical protein